MVLPGFLPTNAIFLENTALIRDDLPTLLLPQNAIWGRGSLVGASSKLLSKIIFLKFKQLLIPFRFSLYPVSPVFFSLSDIRITLLG